MKTLYGLFVLCCLFRLNGKSQGITGTDSTNKVQPWMFPIILADLAKGAKAQKMETNLSRELSLMRFRHSADSTIIAGLRNQIDAKDSKIEALEIENKKVESYHTKYKNANKERWVLRLVVSYGLYDRFWPK